MDIVTRPQDHRPRIHTLRSIKARQLNTAQPCIRMKANFSYTVSFEISHKRQMNKHKTETDKLKRSRIRSYGKRHATVRRLILWRTARTFADMK
jgi:hypothetical protein